MHYVRVSHRNKIPMTHFPRISDHTVVMSLGSAVVLVDMGSILRRDKHIQCPDPLL